MKRLNILTYSLSIALLCILAACGSTDDEPQLKPDDNIEQPADSENPTDTDDPGDKEEENPEYDKPVSSEEFLNIVDGKVWIYDPDYERVLINAKGEEFPLSAMNVSGSSMAAISFKDGKIAIILWASFIKASYKDYVYDEETGEIYIGNSKRPNFKVASITQERIVLLSDFDSLPSGLGKNPNEWTYEDCEPEKGSYSRSGMIIADEETARNYLEKYVE